MYEVQLHIGSSPTFSITEGSVTNVGQLPNLTQLNNIGKKGLFLTEGYPLDGNSTLFKEDSVEAYSGWATSHIADEGGHFSSPYPYVILNVISACKIYLEFDKIADEYATEMIVTDLGIVTNDSFICALNFNTAGIKTIAFRKWNRPLGVFKILSIFTTSYLPLSYTQKRIRSIYFTNNAREDADDLTMGIIMQNGELKLLDSKYLKYANMDETLVTGLTVNIYRYGTKIVEMIITDFDTSDESIWSISLADDFTNWQKEQITPLSTIQSRTLYTILGTLLTSTVINNFPSVIKTRLQNITIPKSYLLTSSKWEAIEKCCVVGLINIYKENGNIKGTDAL